MIDELKEEEIVNKVGGRFKLSTLIKANDRPQPRRGAPVDYRGIDKMSIVIQEIMQEKIYLDMSGKSVFYASKAYERGAIVAIEYCLTCHSRRFYKVFKVRYSRYGFESDDVV